MGNTYCAGAREKMEEKQKATLELYSRVSEKMRRKVEKAKNKTKEKFSAAKLKVKGYSLNQFEDNGETKVITDFENRIPLYLVPLDMFDRHLYKLQSEHGKSITVKVLIDSFLSTEFHQVLVDAQNEDSTLRKLLTHKSLESSQ